MNAGQDYELEVTLKGTTISVVVEGQTVVGHVFNGLVVDGDYGLYVKDGLGSFDEITVITDDLIYLGKTDNTAPIATDNAIGTTENVPLLIEASFLIANDMDADGDILTVASFTQPGHGVVIDNGDASYTYTPESGYIGEDSFIYTITDGYGSYSSAVVHITVIDAGEQMTAAVAPATLSSDEMLTSEQLAPIIDEIIVRWLASGLADDSALEMIENVSFEIVDFSGLVLGNSVDNTIYIDSDAAGYGWFIDESVTDDHEFVQGADEGTLVAIAGSEAYGRMDLLSVVMHEIGHLIGLSHNDDDEFMVMSETLVSGTRLLSTMSQDADIVVTSPEYQFPPEKGYFLFDAYFLIDEREMIRWYLMFLETFTVELDLPEITSNNIFKIKKDFRVWGAGI